MSVYFIQNTRTGSVKIGTSRDAHGRIRGFQTASEDRLDVLLVVEEWGPDDERDLHRRFADLRVGDGGREWFRGDAELLDYIEDLKARRSARAETAPVGLAGSGDVSATALAETRSGLSVRAWAFLGAASGTLLVLGGAFYLTFQLYLSVFAWLSSHKGLILLVMSLTTLGFVSYFAVRHERRSSRTSPPLAEVAREPEDSAA